MRTFWQRGCSALFIALRVPDLANDCHEHIMTRTSRIRHTAYFAFHSLNPFNGMNRPRLEVVEVFLQLRNLLRRLIY